MVGRCQPGSAIWFSNRSVTHRLPELHFVYQQGCHRSGTGQPLNSTWAALAVARSSLRRRLSCRLTVGSNWTTEVPAWHFKSYSDLALKLALDPSPGFILKQAALNVSSVITIPSLSLIFRASTQEDWRIFQSQF